MKKIVLLLSLLILSLPSFAQHCNSAPKGFGFNDGYYTSDISIMDQGPLRYNTLKNYYNRDDYGMLMHPRYGLGYPWWNLILPGLSQYCMDEPGLGNTFLFSFFGCGMLSGVGYALVRQQMLNINVNNPQSVNYGGVRFASALIYLGALGCAAVEICSIVNAFRVVRVKSLYAEDICTYRRSCSFSLQPSVNFSAYPNGYVPAPGMCLRMTF